MDKDHSPIKEQEPNQKETEEIKKEEREEKDETKEEEVTTKDEMKVEGEGEEGEGEGKKEKEKEGGEDEKEKESGGGGEEEGNNDKEEESAMSDSNDEDSKDFLEEGSKSKKNDPQHIASGLSMDELNQYVTVGKDSMLRGDAIVSIVFNGGDKSKYLESIIKEEEMKVFGKWNDKSEGNLRALIKLYSVQLIGESKKATEHLDSHRFHHILISF